VVAPRENPVRCLSAQDMVKAMIAGQRDPKVLAGLARRIMKAKHNALVEALDGMFDDHHGELAQLLLDQIASLDGKIAQLSARAAELAAAMPEGWGIDADGATGPDAGTGPDAPVLNAVTPAVQRPARLVREAHCGPGGGAHHDHDPGGDLVVDRLAHGLGRPVALGDFRGPLLSCRRDSW
jgi:hypothetical protein